MPDPWMAFAGIPFLNASLGEDSTDWPPNQDLSLSRQ